MLLARARPAPLRVRWCPPLSPRQARVCAVRDPLTSLARAGRARPGRLGSVPALNFRWWYEDDPLQFHYAAQITNPFHISLITRSCKGLGAATPSYPCNCSHTGSTSSWPAILPRSLSPLALVAPGHHAVVLYRARPLARGSRRELYHRDALAHPPPNLGGPSVSGDASLHGRVAVCARDRSRRGKDGGRRAPRVGSHVASVTSCCWSDLHALQRNFRRHYPRLC